MSKLLLHSIDACTVTAMRDPRLNKRRRMDDIEVRRTVGICLFAAACIMAVFYGEWFYVPE